jgi:hypothetical protein
VLLIRDARGGNRSNLEAPSSSSLYRWVKNHELLRLRKVTNMEATRIRSSTKENIDPFFNKLEKLQKERNYRMELKVFSFLFHNFFCRYIIIHLFLKNDIVKKIINDNKQRKKIININTKRRKIK